MIDNLMIIDDNDIDQRLARRIVNRSGRVKQIHSFLMAPDALEFLAQSDRPAIDAILLDINMPRMNGFEFLQAAEARHGKGFAGIVVVMLTTSMSRSDRERAAATGMVHDYINKPLLADHLESIDQKLEDFRNDGPSLCAL